MKRPKYTNYSAREIRAKGWLLDQLRIQADSLSGHLDLVWPDIQDSKYVGGDREGWERVPYWLDGFVPLAYLLDDAGLIARAKRYIDAVLNQQQEDGWLCPCQKQEREAYDVWALFLLSKVLIGYYECSQDDRIEPALYRAFQNLNVHLDRCFLFEWGKYRWFEGLIAVAWLYERTGEDWLVELAHKLRKQGTDFESLLRSGRFSEVKNEWTFDTHVVNLAMALKSEALWSLFGDDERKGFEEDFYQTLMKYHGTGLGHFSGDECLAGSSAIRGTELCSIVESMYSYEVLFALTGRTVWLDRLETLAYNAFPATLSPDMWTHQYDQLVNQIACISMGDRATFGTNAPDSHVFGLEPNYGCCTANFSQGWPKLALSAFLRNDRGVVSAALVPAEVSTQIDGAAVRIELETGYPFRNTLVYMVETDRECVFSLLIRRPAWAKEVWVDGKSVKSQELVEVRRKWQGCQTLNVRFEFEAQWERREGGMACLRRGPLYYALPIRESWTRLEYEKDGVARRYPYCDYRVLPLSKWNYGVIRMETEYFEKEWRMPAFSPEHPPNGISVWMDEIDWGLEDGVCMVCAAYPKERRPLGRPKKLTMIPYGCTNLRMAQLPLIGST